MPRLRSPISQPTVATDTSSGIAEVQRLLIAVIVEPRSLCDASSADCDMILRLARRANLLGRLAAALRRENCIESLPEVARNQLVSALAMADARARSAGWELDRIAWVLGPGPAPTLILMKGCAYLALGLPNVEGRIFADVDLMLAEDELLATEQSLKSAGWTSQELTPYDQNYYRRWTHELPPLVHREREVEIDLHHNILPRTARIKPASYRLLENAKPIEGSRYSVLAAEDMVVHAMVHLMFDSDLADDLRDLVDLRDLLLHFSANESDWWQRLLGSAESLGAGRPAYYSLHFAQKLLGLQIPDDVRQRMHQWAPVTPVRWLMDRLVPRALFPQHPDRPSRLSRLCRLTLYVRSHWLRMPPWLLAYHLSYKFVATRLLKTGSH